MQSTLCGISGDVPKLLVRPEFVPRRLLQRFYVGKAAVGLAVPDQPVTGVDLEDTSSGARNKRDLPDLPVKPPAPAGTSPARERCSTDAAEAA
nr:hypothetical protein [Agaricicola taiwanensis]